jgi:NAD(P)-dependent dehydrogenase (short-subunit alcohol dehydrogenase family)
LSPVGLQDQPLIREEGLKKVLEAKVCVVTGAGSGIGQAIAAACAEAGAQVAVLDIQAQNAATSAERIIAQGGRAVAVTCDTSCEESLDHAAKHIAQTLGSAQILINNAAIFRSGPLESFSLSDWNRMLSVNLTGYFLACRRFAQPMLATGEGKIVNIGSLSAESVVPNMGPYSAAKAAVVALTRQMALEWGPRGIRCNVVHPGMIETPATAAAYVDSTSRKARERAVPLGRVGRPEDIAQAAVFLASDQSAYVHGAELTVDGGFGRNLIGLIPRLPGPA